MTLEDKVREIVKNELGVDEKFIVPEASFIADLGADSLGTVELVLAFEKEFHIEIPEEDAEKLTTVGDALAYLKKHVK